MKHNQHLPQHDGGLFLTDGGIETVLIFKEGLELPHFTAFDLLTNEKGRNTLKRYYRSFADVAARHQIGFVLESATWRASPDWAALLGYSNAELADINRTAITLLEQIRREYSQYCIAPERNPGWPIFDTISRPRQSPAERPFRYYRCIRD